MAGTMPTVDGMNWGMLCWNQATAMLMRGRKSDSTRNQKGIAWIGKVSEKFIEGSFRAVEASNNDPLSGSHAAV
jgi:hypothetical protein